MRGQRSAGAVLAGAAIVAVAGCVVLAGCSVSAGTAPDVPTSGGHATSTSTPLASSASPVSSSVSASASSSSAPQKAYVAANSIPFPVAVGNTWVYQTRAGVNGQMGTTTNKIISAFMTSAGYQVTMSSTTTVAGTTTTVQPVYLFYPDGRIGYPLPAVQALSLAGGSEVVWPNAANLDSGRAYHSTLRVRVGQTNQNASITVQGLGTVKVTVPAGTYQAILVDTRITAKVGNFTTTVEVKNWIAQGVGPVKTQVLVLAAGKTTVVSTSELLSFTKAQVRQDGS